MTLTNDICAAPLGLAGRVALVTGAARGIGLATVQQLASAGARVVAFDVVGSPWSEVRATGAVELLEVEGDVGHGPDWERAMQATLQRFGQIDVLVNNAGISGGIGPLVASKHAVVGMTKLAAVELATSGIRVNAVCPAPTSTEMVFSMERSLSPADPEAVRRGMTRMIPMGRYAEPGEIAQLILFLASDASSFMTGTAIPIDGGLKAT
jgi:NAD(P)-dependent dehydrogenase (short-subunit alcohol dehydrogenase family)